LSFKAFELEIDDKSTISRSQSFLEALPHGHFSKVHGHEKSPSDSGFQAISLAFRPAGALK